VPKDIEAVAIIAMQVKRGWFKCEYVYVGETVAPAETGCWRMFVPSRLIGCMNLEDTKELAIHEDLPITYFRR
jgi:hypothetical protein